jgi:hypothetical protein
MKELKQFIKESILDDVEDFNDPFKNIRTDVKNIKDLLKPSNFKKVPKSESGKFFDSWKMKGINFLNLNNDLFNLAGINVLSSSEKTPWSEPAISFSFRKTNDSRPEYRKSTIKLGIMYYDNTRKKQLIRRDIHLNYDEYQEPKDFIKYLNKLFKDEICAIDTIKDIYKNGNNVDIIDFAW